LLKLFVADVLTQVGWQTVPYTRTRSTEASVSETFVCFVGQRMSWRKLIGENVNHCRPWGWCHSPVMCLAYNDW